MLPNLEMIPLESVWEYMNPESLVGDCTDWVCISSPVVSIKMTHSKWHSTAKQVV